MDLVTLQTVTAEMSVTPRAIPDQMSVMRELLLSLTPEVQSAMMLLLSGPVSAAPCE